MLSHCLPSKSCEKSPHKVPSCLPSNPLLSFTSTTNATKRCCLAEPGEKPFVTADGMQMCSLYRYLTASHLSLSPRLVIIPGCGSSRAGAVFALPGTAPHGWSVDWDLQADVMNNNVKLPTADRIVPHSDIRAIHRASLLFFSFQFKALGKCQSDQVKKWTLPLFPEQVLHILVVANNCNCSSFPFPTSNFRNNFLVSNSDSCSLYLSEYGSSEIILGPKSLKFQCKTKAGLTSKSDFSTQLLGRPALSELLTAFWMRC